MAGIGWRLQRLLDRDALDGEIAAYLTGVAVTSAPWLLTTAVLTALRIAGRGASSADDTLAQSLVTAIYAVTLVATAPVHVVVSRYASDRVYERRLDAIGAPLARAFSATLVGGAVAGAVIAAMFGVRPALAVPSVALAAAVAAQWLLLSVGGGLAAPGVVLRAFGAGAAASLFAAATLAQAFGLGAPGHLAGLAAGQLLTVVLMLRGVLHALPAEVDETARLAPAFSEYRVLAASALAFNGAVWTDKLVVWAWQGAERAGRLATITALAWFTVIPAFAWLYVQVETSFYRRYRGFYDALSRGATLAQLEAAAGAIRAESTRVLTGVARVQVGVTLVALAAAGKLAPLLGVANDLALRCSAIAAALQLETLAALLILYYFDLRRQALAVGVTLLIGGVTLPALALAVDAPAAAGTALAAAAALALALVEVRRGLRSLLVDTFQPQPFQGA